MIEAQVVEGAELFPHKCVLCPSVTGPFIDWMVQLESRGGPSFGRLYTCRNCSRTASRLFGFAPGKELTKLQNASERLSEAHTQIAQLEEENAKLYPIGAQMQKVVDELNSENGNLRARITMLEAHIAEKARFDLEFVG